LKPVAKGAYQFAKDILIEAPARAAGSVMLDILGEKQFQPQIGIEKFFLGEKPIEALSERIRKSIPVGERIGETIAGEPGRKIGKYVAPAAVIGMTIADIMPVGGPAKKGAQKVAKEALEATGKEISEQAVKETPKVFEGLKNVTTRLLERLKGLPEKIRPGRFEEIVAKTKKEGLKEVEEKLVRESLVFDERGMIDLPQTAAKVEEKLVPLTPTPVDNPRYIYVGEEFLKPNDNYGEIIYQGSIRTPYAAEIHFDSERFPNYFSHVRYADLDDGKTRKILEIQSDLFQKGKFESKLEEPLKWLNKTRSKEITSTKGLKVGDYVYPEGIREGYKIMKILDENKAVVKNAYGYETIADFSGYNRWKESVRYLGMYDSNQPLAHLRTFREEVKRAAQDGKDTLLIPSGRTAMEIEGLAERTRWMNKSGLRPVKEPKLGQILMREDWGDHWVVTEVLPDGRFRATPVNVEFEKRVFGGSLPVDKMEKLLMTNREIFERWKEVTKRYEETFDMRGKVDPQHFVYKLYEEHIPREARRMGLPVEGKIQLDNGEWWVIRIPPERAQMPVEAFGAVPFLPIISSQLIPERRNEQRKSTTVRKEVIQ
jgi:hypothetical protein